MHLRGGRVFTHDADDHVKAPKTGLPIERNITAKIVFGIEPLVNTAVVD
jgi:hypothetical protein